MDTILNSIHLHPAAWSLGLTWYVVSNAIAALPQPGDQSSTFYRWAYDFSHMVLLPIKRIISARYPAVATAVDATK